MHVRGRTILCLLALSYLFVVPLVGAEAQKAPEKPAPLHGRGGFYLGAGYHAATIGGDFDGTKLVGGGSIAGALPGFSRSGGFEVLMLAIVKRFGFEFGWARTSHNGEWLGVPYDAALHTFDINGRVSLLSRSPVQPHAILGVGIKRLVVKDGAAHWDDIVDAEYMGYGWNIGAGLSVLIAHKVLIDAGAYYSGITYNTLTPKDGPTATITDGLEGSGWSYRAMLHWRLAPW